MKRKLCVSQKNIHMLYNIFKQYDMMKYFPDVAIFLLALYFENNQEYNIRNANLFETKFI